MVRRLICMAAGWLAIAGAAHGQVIQLPTFQSFSVSTTVSVPDSGSGFVGGNRRARSASTSRGTPGLAQIPGVGRLFRNRAAGRELASSAVAAHATIHDMRALDRAAQNVGDGLILGKDVEVAQRAAFIRSNLGAPPAAVAQPVAKRPVESVADIQRKSAALAQKKWNEARAIWEKGRQAELAGKLGVARIHYKHSARLVQGETRAKILAHVQRLEALRSRSIAQNESPSTSKTQQLARRD